MTNTRKFERTRIQQFIDTHENESYFVAKHDLLNSKEGFISLIFNLNSLGKRSACFLYLDKPEENSIEMRRVEEKILKHITSQ